MTDQPTPLTVPQAVWDVLPDRLTHVAKDGYGEIHAFTLALPYEWDTSENFQIEITFLKGVEPGTVDWKHSLIERPKRPPMDKKLKELSEAAAQGEWEPTASSDLTCFMQPKNSDAIIFHGAEANDMRFVAALVNAYRAGKLVFVADIFTDGTPENSLIERPKK